jgi:hypothetical protein
LTWREGSALAKITATRRSRKTRKAPPVGTAFSFSLNEPATVHFTFTQVADGRKVKGKCVAATRNNRRAHGCKRTVTAGALTLTGRLGTNTVAFDGRISHSRKLGLGHYTLTVTATNATGRVSAPHQLSFTIAG